MKCRIRSEALACHLCISLTPWWWKVIRKWTRTSRCLLNTRGGKVKISLSLMGCLKLLKRIRKRKIVSLSMCEGVDFQRCVTTMSLVKRVNVLGQRRGKRNNNTAILIDVKLNVKTLLVRSMHCLKYTWVKQKKRVKVVTPSVARKNSRSWL